MELIVMKNAEDYDWEREADRLQCLLKDACRKMRDHAKTDLNRSECNI
jgi:hypothetical protein